MSANAAADFNRMAHMARLACDQRDAALAQRDRLIAAIEAHRERCEHDEPCPQCNVALYDVLDDVKAEL